jgi:4a-hydroxytetrahydrobiopterin dehydratase
MARMTEFEIHRRLSRLRGWRRRGLSIVKPLDFPSMREGLAFAGRVVRVAEARKHLPDIAIRGHRVTLSLTTHEEGGLTDRDFALAQAIDRLSPR